MNHKFVECTIAGQTFRFNLNLRIVREIHKKFNFDLINIFVDNSDDPSKVGPQTLAIDDEFALDLAWFLLGKDYETSLVGNEVREEFESKIETLEELDSFREAFWVSVVNFTPALKKDHLLTLWKQIKKEFKKINLEEEISNSLSSNLQAEESIQESTASEQS